MATIELKDITKEYRSDEIITPALKNISLKIGTGEFVAIMGASGSGKTTLLNIIGCMDIPTSGTYLLDNEDLGGAKEKHLSSIRGKKISFVFQHFALIDDYTVFENVEIELKYEGYIARQKADIEEMRRVERKKLPVDVDYQQIKGLRLEAAEKLSKVRPENIGQAGRISGVSPADISVLLIWLAANGMKEKKEGGV